MAKSEQAYTLVELVVVMAIFSLVMTLISLSFSKIVSSSSQVMKSAETDLGGLIGLELLRVDLGLAGYGLPWSLGGVSYDEAPRHLVNNIPDTDAASFNDSPTTPPRAFVMLNDKGMNNSDYLVLKGTPLCMTSNNSHGWSYLNYSSPWVRQAKAQDVELTPANGDRVIVVDSGVKGGVPIRELLSVGGTGGTFYTTLDALPDDFKPKSNLDRYLVYGIAPKADAGDRNDKITFPFNRVDYYLGTPDQPSSGCAPGTGRLYRAVITQKGYFDRHPVLDCVGDLQVIFMLDTSNDGTLVQYNDTRSFDAEFLRAHVKEVRVYVLVQQGGKETGYSYPVTDPDRAIVLGDAANGKAWKASELADTFGADWVHYRWKVFTIAVQPKNL